jgi:ABC-type arginine transport system permease subunit
MLNQRLLPHHGKSYKRILFIYYGASIIISNSILAAKVDALFPIDISPLICQLIY